MHIADKQGMQMYLFLLITLIICGTNFLIEKYVVKPIGNNKEIIYF
jgi:hypothetical protein